MRRVAAWLVQLVWLFGMVQAHAVPVTTEDSQVLNADIAWCVSPRETTLANLQAQGCDWQALAEQGLSRGYDPRAHWMRLELTNPSSETVERWLEVGNAQTTELTLYQPGDKDWLQHRLGLSVPKSVRGAVEREYDVLALRLPANARQTLWLRMVSDNPVHLHAKLWRPEVFLEEWINRHFWMNLGLGGLLSTAFLSAAIYALSRQRMYGFFAVALLGQLMVYGIVSGLIWRAWWPDGWTMPANMILLGAVLSTGGMSAYLLTFLPIHARQWRTFKIFSAMVAITGLVLLIGLILGVGAVGGLWQLSVLCSVVCASVVLWRALREGIRAAGILLACFSLFLLVALVRVMVLLGVMSWRNDISQLFPMLLLITSPLILLALVDRSRQVAEALARAEAASAAQLQFLAQMSHELRSPLDCILGYAQLLSHHPNSAEINNGLSSIFDNGRQLLGLIDQILDYARGLAGKLRVEPVPVELSSYLGGIERLGRLLARQHNNEFVMRLKGRMDLVQQQAVVFDPDRMRQVLSNLLGNAARHTQDGCVTLEIDVQAPQGQMEALLWRVIDDGEGIAAKDQKRIFQPFERVIGASRFGRPGVGLGLAICRQLVELMKGKLTVQSSVGAGACFEVSLPVQVEPLAKVRLQEGHEGLDASGYQGRRRHVLIVDDAQESRSILAMLLQDLGFVVTQADSGRQAVALLTPQWSVDLVVADQFMTDGDGWTVLEAFHALRPETPVVLISATPPNPPPDWPNGVRFAATFLRPIDHAKLLLAIGDLLAIEWVPAIAQGQSHKAVPAAAQTSSMAWPWPDLVHRHELAGMLEQGRVTAIRDWAQQLRQRHPAYSDWAQEVISAVQALDFQRLEQLCASAMPGTPS